MFAENGNAILMPYLIGLVNGNLQDVKGTLSSTTHSFLSKTGALTSGNQETTKDVVAVLNIHHPIFKYDQECGPKGTQSIMQLLASWEQDTNVKGVVLDINSGGGQVSGTPEIAEFIHNYSKPIVAYTNDVVGSAAYYIAAAADYFVANKHADFIGSIGTMAYSVDMEGVLIKKGATIIEEYSDLSPEKNKTSREIKKGNTAPLIKEMLNPFAEEFHADVKKYRPSITENALKGDVFRPSQALKEGLIDEIGTLQSAIDKVFELAPTTNTNKSVNMNYPKIEAVAGVKFEGDNKEGVFLNTPIAEAVENKLIADENAIKAANDDAKKAEDDFLELTKANTTIVDEVNASLKLEGDAKVTDVQGAITALNAQITKLSAGPGANHSKKPINKTDEEGHTYMDFETDFYQETEKLFKQ